MDWVAWAESTGMGLWACGWGDGRVIRAAAPWYEIREVVLGLLSDLLLTGTLRAVELHADGQVTPWEGPPSSHLSRIREEWSNLSRRPWSGEICHLVTSTGLHSRWRPTAARRLTAIDAAWLTAEFLAEDDATSIVTFSDPVRFALGGSEATNELIRTETLAILAPLVLRGEIVLGEVGEHRFRRWEGDSESHLARLAAGWAVLGRDILPGDLGYWALAGSTWARIAQGQ